MNIFKLLPITVIALNLNYYSCFGKTDPVDAFKETEFKETDSLVWESENGQTDYKHLTDEFIRVLSVDLIHQAYNIYIQKRQTSVPKISKAGKPGIRPTLKPVTIEQQLELEREREREREQAPFKEILETKIKEYFSSKGTTYNETAIKNFIKQLFTAHTPVLRIDSKTPNLLIDKINIWKDTFSELILKIFQTKK